MKSEVLLHEHEKGKSLMTKLDAIELLKSFHWLFCERLHRILTFVGVERRIK